MRSAWWEQLVATARASLVECERRRVLRADIMCVLA
jgi:hypothetical protein